MKTRSSVILFVSHCLVGAAGFALGIYALPILTAPDAPSEEKIKAMSSQTKYTAKFKRELEDSDTFHWGEGMVSIGPKVITFVGKLAPGPDYKLYLSPEFIETEAKFNQLKSTMVQVGDVKTFDNFVVDVPASIDTSQFSSVIVWCESFGEFITAARYK